VKITVGLDEEVPERVRRALAAVREVEMLDGCLRVAVDGDERPLMLLPRPQPVATDLTPGAEFLATQVPRGAVGLVVGATIPTRERDAIEAAGLSWCDERGAIHVTWPGVIIHIDRGAARPAQAPKTAGQTRLGPASIRAVQVLVEDGEDNWTVSRLAQRAAISTGQAHNVFRALEENRLVTIAGKGPQQRRVLTDHRALLDWLATLDRARRRPETAAAYLYGRTHDEVVARFAERAHEDGLHYAVTGAAGSLLLGAAVLSNITVTHVRVGALRAREALARLGLEHLEAEDAGRGMNLELWTDTGELGTFAARNVGRVRVAPPVRVWLDMAREGGRNADAAQLFREQVLERA
jgi:hypothetical protein